MNPRFYQGVKKLGDATKLFQTEVLPVLSEFTHDALNKVAEALEEKQHEMSQLEATYAEKQRALEVQFNLDVKENERRVLESLAEKHEMVLITKPLFEARSMELANAESTTAAKVAQATTALKKQMETKFQLESNQSVIDLANRDAQITQLEKENNFLREQITSLQGEVEAQRRLTAQVAQSSSSQPNINVGKQ